MGDVTVKMWEMPILLNTFSIIILLVFFLDNQYRHLENKSQKYFFFQSMVISNFLLLVLDGVTWLVAGTSGPTLRTVNIVASTLYYIHTALPSFFFLCFADVVMNVAAGKRRILMRWYTVPVALNFLIAVATPFTGWFFDIDASNMYHRGALLWASFALSFVLLFVAVIKVVIRYAQAHRQAGGHAKNVKEYRWILRYAVISIIGGVIQALFYNVTYIWNVTVIGLLMLYINYQNAEITTDTLTGVYNRRQSFAYFERFLRERAREKLNIAVVMIDINNFKQINDRHGHIRGDEAIIAVARVLEEEFHWDDFICRFGGDEFVVITKHGDLNDLKAIIQSVNDHLTALHREGRFAFELTVSAGFAQYSRKSRTLDSLIKLADEMMFEQKAGLMRRAGDKQGDEAAL